MKIIITKDYNSMSQATFEEMLEALNKPKGVLCFTTGATPTGTFKCLVDAINTKKVDLSDKVFFNVDEYRGSKNGPYSVCTYMHEHLYHLIEDKPAFFDMFDAGALDPDAEIDRFCKVLDSYPRDFQMLGLGTNGHIGANEPGTPFDQAAFLADSFDSTIEATRKLYDLTLEETPTQMFTLGFKEIMSAKKVLLFASGSNKATAVKAVVEGAITEAIPASFLRNHENFVLVIDELAAALLSDEARAGCLQYQN